MKLRNVLFILVFCMICFASGGAVFVYGVHIFASQRAEAAANLPACRAEAPGSIPVVIDEEKFYVADILNHDGESWAGDKFDGKMLTIMQKKDKDRTCYAIMADRTQFDPQSDGYAVLPDGYTQVSYLAVVIPSEDPSSRDIMAIRRTLGSAPRL